MKRATLLLLTFSLLLFLPSCKPSATGEREGCVRHYDIDYNFLLTHDSLVLQEERPMHLLIVPEVPDSFVVYQGDPLVVAQIEIIPEDSIDSVWVKVARDQVTQGWVHESTLLEAVVPDDPISQGIHLFSNTHIIATLSLCILALAAWLLRRMRRQRFHIVHIDDIASPYPMLLCIAFATATVLYTTIQIFAPELWSSYYYHPTLNPFGQPTLLALFLFLAWLIVILTIATLDEVRHSLSATEAILYMLSLLAILAGIYLFFSLATQYFLGYFLLMVYAAMAAGQYFRRNRPRYRCGKCGAPLHEKGICPKCGSMNR